MAQDTILNKPVLEKSSSGIECLAVMLMRFTPREAYFDLELCRINSSQKKGLEPCIKREKLKEELLMRDHLSWQELYMLKEKMRFKKCLKPIISETLSSEETWNLRLYVAGQTPKSLEAFSNLKKLCQTYLKGKYSIEIVNLSEHPELAKEDQYWQYQH